MVGIFFGEDSFGWIYHPINTKTRVEYGDSPVRFGAVVVVAFVLEDGGVTEDGKAVGETSWDEELAVIVFGQFYCYVLAVCRGAFTGVHGYV